MAYLLADLAAALDLAAAGHYGFTGRCPAAGWRRIFGGFVVAQALVAAARTVDGTAGASTRGRSVHALHGTFLLPGDPEAPIACAVERLRDGGSFTARRCTASQHGRPIFAMTASFHAAEPEALDHAAPMPDAPPPESLPGPADVRLGAVAGLSPAMRAYLGREGPVELRPADLARFAGRPAGPHPAARTVWMRAAAPLPDDPVLHAALLAYMSDMTLLDAALVPHGRSVFDPAIQAASLDHAVWFHRPARADGWLLYAEDSPSASGARGFARGTVFDRSGRLVASTAQEGLVRLRG